jgi:hypothetical protein
MRNFVYSTTLVAVGLLQIMFVAALVLGV